VTALGYPGNERDDGRCEQQIDERIAKLSDDSSPERHGRRRAQRVGPAFGEPAGGFARREPVVEVAADFTSDRVDVGERWIGDIFIGRFLHAPMLRD
jgi:hypothetical protein